MTSTATLQLDMIHSDAQEYFLAAKIGTVFRIAAFIMYTDTTDHFAHAAGVKSYISV